MANRVKRAVNLALLLVSTEFFLLLALLPLTEVGVAAHDDNTSQPIISITTFSYPFIIVFYRIIWAGYPSIVALACAVDHWTRDNRVNLVRLTGSSIIGCAVFFAGYYFAFNNDLFNTFLDMDAANPYRTARVFLVIGISSVVAPALISQASARTLGRWLNRLKRSLSLVALLVFADAVLLAIISIAIEIIYIVFHGLDQGGLVNEIGVWWWPAALFGLSFYIVVFYGIGMQNYTLVAILIIAQDFTVAKSRRASLVRLLIASIGGYVLLIGLLALEMGELYGPLFFEIETPWALNFLYTIGIAVILAPLTLFSLSVRIKWLAKLLHGY